MRCGDAEVGEGSVVVVRSSGGWFKVERPYGFDRVLTFETPSGPLPRPVFPFSTDVPVESLGVVRQVAPRGTVWLCEAALVELAVGSSRVEVVVLPFDMRRHLQVVPDWMAPAGERTLGTCDHVPELNAIRWKFRAAVAARRCC